jgi:hypothetical protein
MAFSCLSLVFIFIFWSFDLPKTTVIRRSNNLLKLLISWKMEKTFDLLINKLLISCFDLLNPTHKKVNVDVCHFR